MGFAVEVRATCDKGQGPRMATLGECWAAGVGGTPRWAVNQKGQKQLPPGQPGG